MTKLSTRVPVELVRRLKVKAALDGVTMQTLIQRALEQIAPEIPARRTKQ